MLNKKRSRLINIGDRRGLYVKRVIKIINGKHCVSLNNKMYEVELIDPKMKAIKYPSDNVFWVIKKLNVYLDHKIRNGKVYKAKGRL